MSNRYFRLFLVVIAVFYGFVADVGAATWSLSNSLQFNGGNLPGGMVETVPSITKTFPNDINNYALNAFVYCCRAAGCQATTPQNTGSTVDVTCDCSRNAYESASEEAVNECYEDAVDSSFDPETR